ncbi:M48 family metalloprotease [Longivirga aurantiaca]|uniref:M48 family metalloprotease n=1 Tax=Longivirga aurantiaca TaxID=1837743 RepID=A0ABW1T2T3_9ACTN
MPPDLDLDRDFTADEQRRERAFRSRVRPWGLAGVALGLLVPTVLVLTGATAAVARAAGETWWLGIVAVVVVVQAVTRMATLPGAVAVRRESLRVGLATGGWGRWWRDLAVAWLLGLALTAPAVIGWVLAARLLPGSWWWVVAAAAALLVVLMSFAVPVLVEPLFARFEPMPDGALRERLLALAAEAGVPVRDVLVADASRRTTALNAYVSGLGPTRRIVVHDTLLTRGRDDEAATVVAHELGHVVAHDVRTGTLLGAAGASVGVLVAAALVAWPPLLSASGSTGAADPAVSGLLLALGAWAGFLGSPAASALSRRVERRADGFCLDLARDPAAVASMHRALAVTNLAPLRPVRVLHLWFGTHPTSPERIEAARSWAARHGAPSVPDLRPTA